MYWGDTRGRAKRAGKESEGIVERGKRKENSEGYNGVERGRAVERVVQKLGEGTRCVTKPRT